MKLARIGPMVVACAVGVGTAWSAAPPDSRAESSPRERFICNFRGTQRFIDIYRLGSGGAGGGCRVDYTKNGVKKQVWSSGGDYAYCVKRGVGLVTKLSKGGFDCKPQSAGAVNETTPP
jgi:hypothetical protein